MTKIKINYKINKNKNIKREYDNTFQKKVVALAMKILPQTESFVVQQDKYPYNWIKWGTDVDDVSSEGAVYLSNNLYSSTNTNYGATSMLCTGACWDAMLDFVKDSSHNVTSSGAWGNYYNSETYKVYRGSYCSNTWTASDTTEGTDVTQNKSILLTTGATERNSSKNIYDVAGNCIEWTTEAGYYISQYNDSNRRVLRGWRLLQQ